MAGSSIGQVFKVTTFGESHGAALGCIIDGIPPNLAITEADLQHDLDRRRPGQSRYTTMRQEGDQVKILSGVFEGKTTGCSIGLIIENTDQRSKDYFVPVMQIILIIRNMGTVITEAVAVLLHAKLQCVLLQGRLLKSI